MARNDRPFMIDGVPIKTPDEYKPSIEDLSSAATGRTLDGIMHKDVVAVKVTYACTWKHLSWAEAATIFNAIDGKSSVQFTHADIRNPNIWSTGTFYVGQRSGSAVDLSDPARAWRDLQLSFIEV